MTFQKIINANPYRTSVCTSGALPGDRVAANDKTSKVVLANDVNDVKIGRTEQYLPYPVAYRYVGLGVTGQVVKAGPGRLVSFAISNINAAARYVKIYDKATAPTASDTPVLTLALQPNTNTNMPESDDTAITYFYNGISVRATTGAADNDNTAPGATDVIVNLFYH